LRRGGACDRVGQSGTDLQRRPWSGLGVQPGRVGLDDLHQGAAGRVRFGSRAEGTGMPAVTELGGRSQPKGTQVAVHIRLRV
jgi:hypothetical protein